MTTPQPSLALRALEPGEAPRYPGLRRDGRGVIAGPQGLVVVRGARRMAAFLAALSQVADLSRGVMVETHEDGMGLVTLTPHEAGVPPSQVYDAARGAMAAARLSPACARLYTGDGRVFVPYADPAAPHGYDVDGASEYEPRATSHEARGASHEARGASQGRILLQAEGALWLPLPAGGSDPASGPVPPVPDRLSLVCSSPLVPLRPAAQAPPRTLALLTDRRLAALVAGYAQRHGLAYAVRFLTWERGAAPSEVALFDIVSAAEERAVPSFVCDFLGRLPRTILLADALAPADLEHEPPRRVLVALGQRPPFYLPHIQDLLPAQSILVLGGAAWGAGLLEAPPPRTAMQRLAAVESAAPARVALSERPAGQLRLTLELRRDGPASGAAHAPGRGSPAHGATHALLLDRPALARLRRMVRHLPAPLFAGARVALGDEVALVVAAGERDGLEGLPLGLALARAEPPELLLPRGTRLLPALPQDLLIAALDLRAETLTVLTPGQRYDVPLAALRPLSSLLGLDPAMRAARIEVRPSALPPLDLSGLDEPDGAAPPRQPTTAPGAPPRQPAATPRPAPPEPEQRGVLQRLIGQRPAPGQPAASFEQELRRRAADLEQRGEYELAAAFYTYAGDSKRAAACYRRIVERG